MGWCTMTVFFLVLLFELLLYLKIIFKKVPNFVIKLYICKLKLKTTLNNFKFNIHEKINRSDNTVY